ncbi:MAG: cyclic nucleotide-binding domain-containing protein [Bacteroidota bacterium]|jgi:C4-dicarboxylate-specific signal transduction histidine kinase
MLIKTLEASTLFRRVTPEMVSELASRMEIDTFQPGQTIINKDDEGVTMYFIISGDVKIHDREHLLAKLGKGEFFGEMSILDREPRSMSVTAITTTITGSILRNDLFEVINMFPGMTVELIGFLSRRLRKLNRFMVEQLKNREKELEQQVEERTAELMRKNAELEEAIRRIKQSQQQLIMQEKLASLGSLTAGVAHELHNPLNFVNNFAEICLEMTDDLSQVNPGDVKSGIPEMRNNLEKILFHGQRAESIIRSMIMHSNTGKGKSIEADINELCEQSLSMVSYSSANNSPGCPVRTEKDLDPSIPKAVIIKRDISKVIINILNNAFYEVNKRWRNSGADYTPTVKIATKLAPKGLFVEISDNGFGIPDSAAAKIFEPFFTTKPTGEGVGLGLSISNDIIKAHGGQISMESSNDITLFRIFIPA